MLALRTPAPIGRPCPGCARPMAEVPTIAAPGMPAPLRVDVCPRCELVWFDAGGHQAWLEAPSFSAATVNLPIETQQALDTRGVSARLARATEDRDATARRTAAAEMAFRSIEGVATGDVGWRQLVFLTCGLPVEVKPPHLRSRPWATWTLAALIAGGSLCAFGFGDTALFALGLVPAELGRYGGLTLATSFFLHENVWHLLVNLYFLLVFGDDVEDRLGRGRHLILVALSALAGGLTQAAIDPRSTIPIIGASGGISGVIGFYALSFPGRRLRFALGFVVPVRLLRYGVVFDARASAAMVMWLVLQLIGAVMEVMAEGAGGVAYLAHLAGATAGVAFWWLDR